MQKISEIYFGIKSGKYWFITLALTIYMISFMYLKNVENKTFNSEQEQRNEMHFAARLILAAMSSIVFSILFVLMSGPILKVVTIVLGVLVVVAMIKVDKLPIWMEK